jgi:hypothetical protein
VLALGSDVSAKHRELGRGMMKISFCVAERTERKFFRNEGEESGLVSKGFCHSSFSTFALHNEYMYTSQSNRGTVIKRGPNVDQGGAGSTQPSLLKK